MILNNFPFAIPFTFTSVDDDFRRSAPQRIPYNLAVYGITLSVSSTPQAGFYHANVQFQNFQTGDVLFDESVTNACIQTDARTYFRLPSKWFIRKNETIICSLNSFDSVASRTYYITLLAYIVDSDPNPGMQPFIYSFQIPIGFQDNVGGSTTGPVYNQGLTGTQAKHMLHDFDLHGFVLDPWGGDPVLLTGVPEDTPSMAFQISTQRRKLFDRFIIDGCAGGGFIFSQGDVIPWMAGTAASVYGFPQFNSLQYWLPQAERIPKGELVRVDISPAPTYVDTNDIHTVFNQVCTMALIGNHIG